MVSGPGSLIVRSPEVFRDQYAIDVRLRHEVTAIDLDRREVVVRALYYGAGRTANLSTPWCTPPARCRTPWPEQDVGGIFGVQTLNDGMALREWLSSHPHMRRGVVVGGGYIGVSMAESLVRRGLAVTLIDRAEQPMSTVDTELGKVVRDALVGIGVDVRSGVSATGIDHENGRVTAVHTTDDTVPADVVVLGLGVRPTRGSPRRPDCRSG